MLANVSVPFECVPPFTPAMLTAVPVVVFTVLFDPVMFSVPPPVAVMPFAPFVVMVRLPLLKFVVEPPLEAYVIAALAPVLSVFVAFGKSIVPPVLFAMLMPVHVDVQDSVPVN